MEPSTIYIDLGEPNKIAPRWMETKAWPTNVCGLVVTPFTTSFCSDLNRFVVTHARSGAMIGDLMCWPTVEAAVRFADAIGGLVPNWDLPKCHIQWPVSRYDMRRLVNLAAARVRLEMGV